MEAELEQTPDQNLGTLRRHDVIVSIILWIVTLLALLDSCRMTFGISLPGVDTNVWLVAPGFLPMILSGGLLVMLSALIWVSVKQADLKGHFTSTSISRAVSDRETVTRLLQMILLCILVFGLLGRLHFGIASALYLFAAMSLARAAKLWQTALIAVLFSGVITFIFGTLMKIPLP